MAVKSHRGRYQRIASSSAMLAGAVALASNLIPSTDIIFSTISMAGLTLPRSKSESHFCE